MIKRRDFVFHEMLPNEKKGEVSLFSKHGQPLFSDLGADVFIPEPVREYPLIHFLRVADVEQQ